jgi:hypothetical protein
MARSRYDDDEDDYDDRPPPPPKSEGGGRTAITIVAIVGAVVVVIVLICGGAAAVVGYSIYSGMHSFANKVEKFGEQAQQQQASQEDSKRAAEAFLRDLRNNRLDSAYQSTSATYQKRLTRKDFDAFVTAHAALKTQPQVLMPHGFNGFGNTTQFDFEYTTAQPGKLVTVIVSVVKEGDKWKIEDVEAD